jgi:hypothetical protein
VRYLDGMKVVFGATALLSLGCFACGGTSDAGQIGPGVSCNVPEASCASGTSCLTESVVVGSGCSSMERLCTVACTNDEPCVSLLGLGAHCSAACGGSPSVCIPAQ